MQHPCQYILINGKKVYPVIIKTSTTFNFVQSKETKVSKESLTGLFHKCICNIHSF